MDTIEWPQYSGPRSPVIKNPAEWQDKGILVPHEAVRLLHAWIREILPNYNPLDGDQSWKTPLFFNWLSTYYVAYVHHHHHAEEEIYNPGIVEKGAKLPTKISSDHRDLLSRLDKIESFEQAIANGDKVALQGFKDHMTKLMDTMDEHMNEEEQIYPQALRACGITQEEEGEIVQKIVQGIGLSGNKTALPGIVYAMHMWAGAQEVEKFMERVPPPIRFLYRHFWIHDFRDNNLAVAMALKGNVPYEPATPACECSVQ
mmetsp:Transcript_21280/g.38842  ORF Transcript_21280/g.38842 Transcript_21280/m.38842 type:complete len:258 (-) Transcript_21280:147-920(-)